jgi:hypothetical protein
MGRMPQLVSTQSENARTPEAIQASKTRESFAQVAIYVATAVASIGAAVNSIRHKFYDEMKVIGPFKELHNDHKKKVHAIELKPGQTAAELQQEIGTLEENYTKEFQALVLKKRGIHSAGPEGWIEGTYQRWKSLGPHTRTEVVFNVATAAIVTIGTLFTLKQSKFLNDAINHSDESKAQSR